MLGEENWRDIGYGVQIEEKWCVGSTNSLILIMDNCDISIYVWGIAQKKKLYIYVGLSSEGYVYVARDNR